MRNDGVHEWHRHDDGSAPRGRATVSETQPLRGRPARAAASSGSAVARMLTEHADDLAARVGAPLELVGIAVRRAGSDRVRRAASTRRCSPPTPRTLVTRADVVIEVIGGIEPARSLILARAWSTAPRVVTANKALLAEDGPTLYAAADAARRRPLLRGRRRRRHPDPAPAARVARRRRRAPGARHRQRHHQLHPRQDGHHRRRASPRPSSRPRRSGYAEADPTADVEGFDAAAKAAILARLAFHTRVTAADVHREGITEVTAGRRRRPPREMDCVVKLLAICERVTGADGADARQRARAPGDDPAQPPAGQRPRGLQRRLRRGRRRRRADVLRPRRRRRPDRLAPCSATSSPWPGTGVGGGRGPGESAYADLPVLADGRGPDALPHQPRRGRPPGRARPGRDGVRRARRLDRDGAPAGRAAGEPGEAAPSLVVVTHTAPPTPPCRRPSTPSPTLDDRRRRRLRDARGRSLSRGAPVARSDPRVRRPAADARGRARS